MESIEFIDLLVFCGSIKTSVYEKERTARIISNIDEETVFIEEGNVITVDRT